MREEFIEPAREVKISLSFHNRKDINWWYLLGTITLFTFGILIWFFLPENTFKIHAIVNYFVFLAI